MSNSSEEPPEYSAILSPGGLNRAAPLALPNVGTVGGNAAAFLLYNSENTGSTINPIIGPTSGTATINLGSATSIGGLGYGNTNPPEAGTTLGPTLPFYYTLTIASGVTVQGAGQVGSNDYEAGSGDDLVNDGTISVNIANTSLRVSSGPDNINGSLSRASNLINNGTIQATTSGTQLSIISGTVGNLTNASGGTISATGGSTVTLSGVVSSFETASNIFTNYGTLNAGTGSPLDLNNTTSTQASGTTTVNGTLSVGGSGTYTLNGGTLTGSGTFNGNLANASGTIELGAAGSGGYGGTLTLNGNFTQSATGKLQIDLPASGGSGALTISGNATLGGTLTLLNTGFVPTQGSHDEIVQFSSNSGNTTFSNVADDGVLSDGTTHYVVTYNNAANGGVFLTAPILGMAVGNSFVFK